MSRDEKTTGGKTKTAKKQKERKRERERDRKKKKRERGPFLYSLRRDEGKKYAEKSDVELRNVGGNVA